MGDIAFHFLVDGIGVVIGLLKIGGGRVVESVGNRDECWCWCEVKAGVFFSVCQVV